MGSVRTAKPKEPLRVCELFAGVGGFHLGLRAAGMEIVWANQWEPGTKAQHAYECYERHFPSLCVNEDIGRVIDEHQKHPLAGRKAIPTHDVLVGGFPCQDYSVAKPLSMADGIMGKKGVLWWQIERWVRHFKPKFLFLENVDRLLKSPTSQRGRDFAVMLSCLALLGYEVEWRVINAADYGFPQKRRRVFIVGRHRGVVTEPVDPLGWLLKTGILAKACPVATGLTLQTNIVLDGKIGFRLHTGELALDPGAVSRDFNLALAGQSVFRNAGYMRDGEVWSFDVEPRYVGRRLRLRDVLEPDADVPNEYRVPPKEVAKWKYLKGAKRELRVHPKTGFKYHYTEGGIPFPDPVSEPSRTILTGEGGRTPSRFKHLIAPTRPGRYRRLTPVELERLNGFPDGWTDTGMPPGRRAFCMGNALVVGLVERIGRALANYARAQSVVGPRRAAVAEMGSNR